MIGTPFALIAAGKVYWILSRLGWKDEELATRVGVSQELVSRWKTGKTIPNACQLSQIDSVIANSCHCWPAEAFCYVCSFSRWYHERLPNLAHHSLCATLDDRPLSFAAPLLLTRGLQFDLFIRPAHLPEGVYTLTFGNHPLCPSVLIVLVPVGMNRPDQSRAAWAEVFEHVARGLVAAPPTITPAIMQYQPCAEHLRPAWPSRTMPSEGRSVSDMIRCIRRHRGWSERRLGENLVPTVQQPNLNNWANGHSKPGERARQQLETLFFDACRYWDCKAFADVCALSRERYDWWPERARAALTNALRTAPISEPAPVRSDNLQLDLHLRFAPLALGVSAHTFRNHPEEGSVFVVLVDEKLSPAQQYRTAWAEVYAHVLHDPLAQQRPTCHIQHFPNFRLEGGPAMVEKKTRATGVTTDGLTEALSVGVNANTGEARLDAAALHHATIADVPPAPTWVAQSTAMELEWKRAIARYAASHLIRYGDALQLGPGTTLNCLMDAIIDRQESQNSALDLIILTSNLQILAKGRNAHYKNSSIFETMQIILTGGALQTSLDSLVGDFAAAGVINENMHPRVVFFGVAGLSFRNKQLTVTYHFPDEISTQVAYATRSTEHRVILCNHTRLGERAAIAAGLTIQSLLANTNQCTVITTFPEDDAEALRKVEQEEQAFIELLRGIVGDGRYADKDLALLLIARDGKVKREHSLKAMRAQGTAASA
jgi:DeoR/GlpR family transcriptional regulator of sugar metabolism/ribosome-binding protein aMBF1 (putative translation factor)